MQSDGLALPSDSQIEHFHQDGKAHGEVNVSLRDMLVKSFDDQGKTDQQKEAQCQHFDSRMAFNKIRQRRGSKHHNCCCNNDCRDHDLDVVHHPNGSDDGIKREYNIQQHDLEDDTPEYCSHFCRGLTILPFQFLVNLMNALPKQEEPTCQ